MGIITHASEPGGEPGGERTKSEKMRTKLSPYTEYAFAPHSVSLPMSLVHVNDLEKIITREGLNANGKCEALKGVLLFTLDAARLFKRGNQYPESFLLRIAEVSPDTDGCLSLAIQTTPHAVKFLTFLAENTEDVGQSLGYALEFTPEETDFLFLLVGKTKKFGGLLDIAITCPLVVREVVLAIAKETEPGDFDKSLYYAIFYRSTDTEIQKYLFDHTTDFRQCRNTLAGMNTEDNPALKCLKELVWDVAP